MICKHCGHDTNDVMTRSVVVDLPERPVAAPCTISGCQLEFLGPYLLWEGPDEDGDMIVHLRGIKGWGLATHGPTAKDALVALAEVITAAYEMGRPTQ